MQTWFDAQLDQKILGGIYVWVLKSKMFGQKQIRGAVIVFCLDNDRQFVKKLLNFTFYVRDHSKPSDPLFFN